jgi:hypothetical protein
MRTDTFFDFEHLLIEQFGQLDLADEELRSSLMADAQLIGKASCGDEERGLSLTFEQGIGGDRRAHLDRLDRLGRDRLAVFEPEQFADALHGGIAIALRVFGEQLVGDQLPVRAAGDDVGEGAAAVDPELPAG